MAIFRHGNMWSCFKTIDFFVITTNSFIKGNGSLAMGRGIAGQAKDNLPGLDAYLGEAVRAECGHLGIYGFMPPVFGFEPGRKICMFQTKRHFKDPSEMVLIKLSMGGLRNYATALPHRAFALNFPGIGNGQLDKDDVLPVVANLPDNVHIWTLT